MNGISNSEGAGSRLKIWWARFRSVFALSEDSGSSTTASQKAGEWGEAVAAEMLKRSGYKILGTRVRVGRHDELDLVARDGEVLVFVEVKTRSGVEFGRPVSAVNKRKRHALSRAAVHYLRELRFPKTFVRFDVIEVVGDYEDGKSLKSLISRMRFVWTKHTGCHIDILAEFAEGGHDKVWLSRT